MLFSSWKNMLTPAPRATVAMSGTSGGNFNTGGGSNFGGGGTGGNGNGSGWSSDGNPNFDPEKPEYLVPVFVRRKYNIHENQIE